MDSQNKTRRLYIITIIIFIAVVVLGQLAHLWRGDDYKFLLLLFLLISIALRLDEIYNELAASKTKASDMYLLDTRMQAIIESLDNLNRRMDNIACRMPNYKPPQEPKQDPAEPDLY